MQTPLEKYKNDLGLKGFNTDPAQETSSYASAKII